MGSLKVAIFLAFKSIVKGHKYTIALMVFILSLSFVNLVFIASILGGMVDAINKQIINNYTSYIVIDPQDEPTRKDFIPRARELQQQIEQIPGIIATARHYKLAGTMAYDKEKNGKFKFVAGEIIGIEPEREKLVTNISQRMVDGQYLKGLGGMKSANKRRQIGILKAIGIKQDTIVYSYILQAIFYTFSGIVIGLLLIFYLIAPYFAIHPLRLPIGDIGLALHGSRIIYSILSLFAVSLVAGFIPSWQVTRQNILKTIWGT